MLLSERHVKSCVFEFIWVEGDAKFMKLLGGGGVQATKVWKPLT
jgi:hypothetical protein